MLNPSVNEILTCASMTRPAAPNPNMVVRSTDTGRALRWIGGEWADDLVAWLTWAIDRAEQKVRAATPGPWVAEVDDYQVVDGYQVRASGSEPTPVAQAGCRCEGGAIAKHADAEHIADHDPSWRLADLARKRKILAEHGDQHDCGDRRSWEYPYVGCTTLRLLAEEFAGEPGYDESWRA